MRSPHHLHGVLDMAPLIGFFGVALALASQGIFGRLRNSSGAMPLEHLPRDGVDLGFGCHLALRDVPLIRAAGTGSAVAPPRSPKKPLNRRSRSSRRAQFDGPSRRATSVAAPSGALKYPQDQAARTSSS